MDDVTGLVTGHYGAAGLEARILGALADAGVDLDRLTAADLAPVDELHAGGLAETLHLLSCLDLPQRARLLDVGCGLGGSSRVAASSDSRRVTGVDLTAEYVHAATALTARVGLADRATFQTTKADRMPFADGSFDAAMMIHVGMNLPDKASVFAEVHRVLEPGGRFGIFDQMVGSGAPATYPLPWAEDDRASFLETPHRYAEVLRAAGFEIERQEDRSTAVTWPRGEGQLGPGVVFGPAFGERIRNQISDARSGALLSYLLVARAL
jgi:SAM-dependent methyltransferase